MSSRRFHFIGRNLVVLFGCVAVSSLVPLAGQTGAPSPSAPAPKIDQGASRIDVFLGYSYLAPHGTVTTAMPSGNTFADNYSSVNEGAIGSVAYYFSRYVGGQVEYATHPGGANDGMSTAQAGIIFRYPTEGMTVFVHGLAGGARIGGPNYPGHNPPTPDTIEHPYTWGPALTIGGGLDFNINQRFAIRLFQADYEYMHADFGPQPQTGGRANIDAARLSAGLVVHFGNIVPPPPVQYSCAVNPSTVFPGDEVTVTGTATNLNPKKQATYNWSGQGLTVGGTDPTTKVSTGNLQPGTYTVTGHVTEGPKAGQSADCTAQFTVKQFEPPTVSCTAEPTTVKPGESSTITCNGVSPQNRPLTYSYSASAGSISGTSNSATLSTTGAPAGTITVTGTVTDDKGQTASATTTVDVQAPPPPPAPKSQTLCSITFDKDKRRPARVDNEAKACLDDVALNAQQKADASLVVVGNSAPVPTTKTKYARRHALTAEQLAAQRAVNTKAYLVTEKGIDASRIQVRTGTGGQNEVENYLVPAGANFDADVLGTSSVDENSVKAQPRTPVRRHHHRAAKKASSK